MSEASLPRKEARIVTGELLAIIAAIDAVFISPPPRDPRAEHGGLADVMVILDYPREMLIVLRNDIVEYLEAAIERIAPLTQPEEGLFDAIDDDLSLRSLRDAITAAVSDVEGAKDGLRRLRNRIRERLKGFGAAAASVKTGAGQALDWIKSIMGWLRNVCGTLWAMLARLTKPVEWKLSGKVGTGALGLLDVGIEITFRADDKESS